MVETKINKLKAYAKEYNVPIMLDDGIAFLTNEIKKRNIKTILEVGSAIGYSSIMMALCNENIKVITIEKDVDRYNEAVKNIKDLDLDKRITIYNDDALNINLKDKFDLIFIDAAKSRNKDMFNHFKNNLNKNGIIVTDNLSFHGFVEMKPSEIKNRNTRQLVRKINEYISFLKDNKEYKTEFFTVGDGISITKKESD